MENKIAGVNEIMGALLSADIGDSIDKLKADANGFVAENYGVDLSAFEISVAENSASQVHLSLPYYNGLEEASAKAMADNEVADVAGGDIITLIIAAVIIGAIAAPAVIAVGGAAAGIGVSANEANK